MTSSPSLPPSASSELCSIPCCGRIPTRNHRRTPIMSPRSRPLVDALKQSAGTQTGPGAVAAKRLAEDLAKIASGDKAYEDERMPPWSPRSTPRLTNYGTTCRRSGHARNPASRDRRQVGHARRALQGGNSAERRSDRQRDVAPVRARSAGGRAECHWRPIAILESAEP